MPGCGGRCPRCEDPDHARHPAGVEPAAAEHRPRPRPPLGGAGGVGDPQARPERSLWLLRRPVGARPGGWWCGSSAGLLHGHGTLATSLLLLVLAVVLAVVAVAVAGVVHPAGGVAAPRALARADGLPVRVAAGDGRPPTWRCRWMGGSSCPSGCAVSSTGTVDRVWVRMLPGQVFDDWAAMGQRLAQTFGAQECRVRTTEASSAARAVVPHPRPAHRPRRAARP